MNYESCPLLMDFFSIYLNQHDPIIRHGSFSFCTDPIKPHVSLFCKCIGSIERSVLNKRTVSSNWNTRVINFCSLTWRSLQRVSSHLDYRLVHVRYCDGVWTYLEGEYLLPHLVLLLWQSWFFKAFLERHQFRKCCSNLRSLRKLKGPKIQ